MSRRTKTTYADSKFITYSWDDTDNLSGWSDQNGTSVSNTHDALNRLTARRVNRGTGVLSTMSESYTYDALDRMLTAVDDDYQVEFDWDSVGNRLRERQGYTKPGQERWKSVGGGCSSRTAAPSRRSPIRASR